MPHVIADHHRSDHQAIAIPSPLPDHGEQEGGETARREHLRREGRKGAVAGSQGANRYGPRIALDVSWRPDAPPGWYPDPSGTPADRWWDGSQWTQRTEPWPAAASVRRRRMWILVAIAGCTAFVGSLLPWVSVAPTGTLDLPHLIGETNGRSELALLVIGGGVALVVIGILGRAKSTMSAAGIALVIGVVCAALTGIWGIGLVSGSTGIARVGIGPFVTIGGFALATVSAARLWSTATVA